MMTGWGGQWSCVKHNYWGVNMRNPTGVLLVVALVFIGVLPVVVSAGPIIDTDVSITHHIDDGDAEDLHDENGWLVAGSGVCSTIRVCYTGNTTVDIHSVRFTSGDGGVYGSVTGDYIGNLSYYDGIFSASANRAGNATIGVHVNYSVNGTGYDYYRTVSQPIDHGAPMNIRSIVFDSEVTIGTVMNITMTMEDAYGNTVTSLYEDATGSTQECVTFETTRYAGSGLYDCTGYDADAVMVPVNADGTVLATFKLGTEAGPKYLIHVIPPAYADDTWLTVTGLADAKPHAISVSVVPNVGNPPYLPADGQSRFYLTYHLFDRYGNPSGNQTVQFMDTISSDVFTQRTNSAGQIMITFGPFDTTGIFTIHAMAMENASVSVDQEVRFTNTSPEEMLLTANPQSMPSADVAGAGGSAIIAKVMDENGNGVPAEKVTFNILPRSDYSIHQIAEPTLEALEAYTNADGVATVNFTPGAFETDSDNLNYSETASESCTVEAVWGAKKRTIDLEWKNYPYLRVETAVDPTTVEVGRPVDVTVRLIGDGWALYPDPIDVMLCADRSGSMGTNESGTTRIDSLKSALKIFNGQMTEERDQVGLTSFGSDATLDLPFTSNHSEVEDAIDALKAYGWTSMRQGLYLALRENIEHGREGAVQAVVLLSDGDYNWYGDPLARRNSYTGYSFGSITEDYTTIPDLSPAEQNLSVYAASNNVTIYSIAFKDGISGEGKETLQTLAESTGGKYYYAPNASQLATIYTSIAGELKTEAGVNTAMNVKFDRIEVNNVPYQNIGSNRILAYEYVDGVSTLVKGWNSSGSGVPPYFIGPMTLNQTDDWAATRCLTFDSGDIGTIRLGQTWQATFRLNVSKAGNINLFGNGSLISFNNGTDSLALPKTYITAVPDLNATGINFTELEVWDLKCVEAENGCEIKNDLTIQWNLNYSGAFTANQSLFYQNVDDGVWVNFGREKDGASNSTQSHYRKLYVADFPPGEYKLRVWATAMDTPDSIAVTLSPITIGSQMKNYILLE